MDKNETPPNCNGTPMEFALAYHKRVLDFKLNHVRQVNELELMLLAREEKQAATMSAVAAEIMQALALGGPGDRAEIERILTARLGAGEAVGDFGEPWSNDEDTVYISSDHPDYIRHPVRIDVEGEYAKDRDQIRDRFIYCINAMAGQHPADVVLAQTALDGLGDAVAQLTEAKARVAELGTEATQNVAAMADAAEVVTDLLSGKDVTNRGTQLIKWLHDRIALTRAALREVQSDGS